MALFEPDRHEPLSDTPWDEAAVRAHIARIVTDTHDAYRGEEGLWPIHPMDVSDERPDPMKSLYYGAAGVIWALRSLERSGAVPAGGDYARVIEGLLPRVQTDALRLTGRANHGFLPGETGILMLQFVTAKSPSPALEDAIEASIATHRDDPAEGFLAGAPGTLHAALLMYEETSDPRWAEAWRATADALWDRWTYNETAECWLWRQDLYGEVAHQLGALHGFAGVAYAFLRGQDLLPGDRATEAVRRIQETVSRTAISEAGLVNWPFEAGGDSHPGSAALRVQHCMGAPGFLNCLCDLPADPHIDGLMIGAGDLIWAAGPLAKHPCLCHGVPGSGYGFLNLFQRTGNQLWADRARAFAMHAIGQNEAFTALHGQRKYSLWTGDLGLALFLWACVQLDADVPTMDFF